VNESNLPEFNDDYENQQQAQDQQELEQRCLECLARIAQGMGTQHDALFLASVLGLTHHLKGH
jgi:hypothetical protein